MILVQMYNIFGLLIGVPDDSIVVSRMEKNKTMEKNMGILISILFFLENGVWRKIRTHLNLLMILVQIHNIFRLLIGVLDYSRVVSHMDENKNM